MFAARDNYGLLFQKGLRTVKSYWDKKRLGKFFKSHYIGHTKTLRLKGRTFIKSYMKQT